MPARTRVTATCCCHRQPSTARSDTTADTTNVAGSDVPAFNYSRRRGFRRRRGSCPATLDPPGGTQPSGGSRTRHPGQSPEPHRLSTR
ncbi:hypothetical protein I545_1659 [Mycobacterium kansasii 662]|uniref:Uncharacterized protein n=1 Tax=Mycobacterium kansasii 662 TaxID=1299326 RepID=X7ZUH2_MYCKA|nr:hypothetical protein I545_1659 [Mycobacterium kansasii 662]